MLLTQTPARVHNSSVVWPEIPIRCKPLSRCHDSSREGKKWLEKIAEDAAFKYISRYNIKSDMKWYIKITWPKFTNTLCSILLTVGSSLYFLSHFISIEIEDDEPASRWYSSSVLDVFNLWKPDRILYPCCAVIRTPSLPDLRKRHPFAVSSFVNVALPIGSALSVFKSCLSYDTTDGHVVQRTLIIARYNLTHIDLCCISPFDFFFFCMLYSIMLIVRLLRCALNTLCSAFILLPCSCRGIRLKALISK